MSKKRRGHTEREAPINTNNQSQVGMVISNWDTIECSGYVPLSKNPEIISAVNKISNLIADMTIHLMENTDHGDQRVKNELSRKVDINPNEYMTRHTFMSGIVRALLLEGDGNAVIYPQTEQGFLRNLFLLPPSSISFVENINGWGYQILYNGRSYTNDELIHIVLNPDPNHHYWGTGYRKTLRSVADSLKQADSTKNGFMKSKWKPSVIVKADGSSDEFSSKEGRSKLLKKYIEASESGEPWIIPADQFDVFSVKPLSLTDLAIKDSIELDKKTVASILDIPGFVLGIGEFKQDQWNNFISTRIRDICMAIEQALTKTLLISPNWYFRLNYRSLFAYDIKTLTEVGAELYVRGIITGNEVRDSLGYSLKDGLDDLVILENYIPLNAIGNQKKLAGGEKNE